MVLAAVPERCLPPVYGVVSHAHTSFRFEFGLRIPQNNAQHPQTQQNLNGTNAPYWGYNINRKEREKEKKRKRREEKKERKEGGEREIGVCLY